MPCLCVLCKLIKFKELFPPPRFYWGGGGGGPAAEWGFNNTSKDSNESSESRVLIRNEKRLRVSRVFGVLLPGYEVTWLGQENRRVRVTEAPRAERGKHSETARRTATQTQSTREQVRHTAHTNTFLKTITKCACVCVCV